MSPRSLPVTTLVAGALLLAAAPLRAQSTTQAPDTIVVERPTVIIPRGSLPPAPVHRNLVSVQPLAVSFEVYQAEYERALGPNVTLGLGGSVWNHFDVNYRSADLKLRYYPGARALQGFSFGLSGGFANIVDRNRDCDYVTGECRILTERTRGPSLGTLFEYNWLLGPTQNFQMGLGLGTKVIFAKEQQDHHDVTLRYPTMRLSIGWAF